ncbi:hypothetical protein [Herbaspirillum robiniae]|uniref:Uncharacterized protein n=1 Tax=Herbaspirillum robiniae TaxID=2014887 RepID=A0ABX2LWU7_9BURK|nr:hypothetical protein [Herbaspirillum robiniae]NUU02960.1 hypothetical protein [Herbaspirillum robiniae]
MSKPFGRFLPDAVFVATLDAESFVFEAMLSSPALWIAACASVVECDLPSRSVRCGAYPRGSRRNRPVPGSFCAGAALAAPGVLLLPILLVVR